jgi:DoxX-like protein
LNISLPHLIKSKKALIFIAEFQNIHYKMTTKTINLIYWISTILFAALMIFSAAGGLQPSQQAIQLIHDGLGYPVYFIQFISIAKLIGAIVILIPGLPRSVKEWAYAGLFFDLASAIYSGIASSGKFDPQMLGLLVWIVPGIVSYYYWHKKIYEDNLGQSQTITRSTPS